jgi:hypothetical protein
MQMIKSLTVKQFLKIELIFIRCISDGAQLAIISDVSSFNALISFKGILVNKHFVKKYFLTYCYLT